MVPSSKSIFFVFRLPLNLLVGLFVSCNLFAQVQQQNASGITTVFKQLQQVTNAWVNPIMNAATDLFWLLATIEFAWAGISYLREHDIGGLFIALVRRILIIGFFAAVLINGHTWIPAIINSFVQIGSNASGLPVQLDPAAMLADGLKIVNQLGNTIQFAGLFTNPGAALMTVAVSLIVMAAYVLIVFHYLVTKLESIILLSAGYVFVGFGGHSSTRPYLERYISLALGTGVRLMVIYLMLGAFHSLSQQWVQDMGGFTAQQSFDTLFPTLCAIVLYALASWKIPKLCGSLASGSLGMGAGDLIGPMVTGAELAATAAVMAATIASGMGAPAAVAEGAAESSLLVENITVDAAGAAGGVGGGAEGFAGAANYPGPPPDDFSPHGGSSGAPNYPGPPPDDSYVDLRPGSDGVYDAQPVGSALQRTSADVARGGGDMGSPGDAPGGLESDQGSATAASSGNGRFSYARTEARSSSWYRESDSARMRGRRGIRVRAPRNDGAGHVPPPQIRMDGE
jgi:type IV secretion system protein TrbL